MAYVIELCRLDGNEPCRPSCRLSCLPAAGLRKGIVQIPFTEHPFKPGTKFNSTAAALMGHASASSGITP